MNRHKEDLIRQCDEYFAETGRAPVTRAQVNAFHDHLDVCEHCKAHPFDLCSTGRQLLAKEAGK